MHRAYLFRGPVKGLAPVFLNENTKANEFEQGWNVQVVCRLKESRGQFGIGKDLIDKVAIPLLRNTLVSNTHTHTQEHMGE